VEASPARPGAASFLTETVSRVRADGAAGQPTVRADSVFYSKAVLSTATKFDVRFSITARQDKRTRAAIDAIADGSAAADARTRRRCGLALQCRCLGARLCSCGCSERRL
jgi:hypothetical protein